VWRCATSSARGKATHSTFRADKTSASWLAVQYLATKQNEGPGARASQQVEHDEQWRLYSCSWASHISLLHSRAVRSMFTTLQLTFLTRYNYAVNVYGTGCRVYVTDLPWLTGRSRGEIVTRIIGPLSRFLRTKFGKCSSRKTFSNLGLNRGGRLRFSTDNLPHLGNGKR